MAMDINDLFEKANNYYYQYDYDKALELYKQIVEQDPGHYQSLEKIGKIELTRGNLDKAIENYEKSLAIHPEETNTWNDLGNLYYDKLNYIKAIESYKKAIEHDNEYYWAYYNVGLAIKQNWPNDDSKNEEAKSWYEKALSVKNDYHPALNELGLYYLDKNEYDKAEDYFKKTIKAYNAYKYAYYNLSSVAKEKGQIDKAKAYLLQAIKIDPNYLAALNNIGILFYNESDYMTALYYYTRALEIDKKYKYALYNIGLVFDCMEQYRKSYEMHKRTLESDLNYSNAKEEKERLEKEYPDEIKNQQSITEDDLKSSSYLNKAKIPNDSILNLINNDIPSTQNNQGNQIDQNVNTAITSEENFLEKFGRNISKMARDGKLFEVLGRDKEIRSTLEVLFKIQKNNPLLVGKAGVGKTAIVEGLAQKIVKGDVPEFFKKMEIIEINMGMVVAGTKYRGEFETRLKRIIDEVKNNENIILFIDEIHTIVGAGETEDSTLDAANILKPALARGDLRCIGATTTDEYKKYFQKDAALDRRFYLITVDELDKDSSLQILKNLKPKLEDHYKITIDDSLLKLIIDLSNDEIKTRVFPDKAIDILEKTFSRCALDGKSGIDEITIKNIIGEFVGIKFLETEEDKGKHLLEMEKYLKERVYGQDEAINRISNVIRMTKQKLDLKPYQPDGVFFFAGPSGVGKTYLAKQIALFLYGTEDKLITINMSEFTEPHSVSKLIGSPPGYIGYNDTAVFSTKVMENPSSVLLLDEVEKAHPEVLKLFLRIFDEGKIEDTHGRIILFSNITIIMTSNAIGMTKSSLGFQPDISSTKTNADIKLTNVFPPEFVNRIDEVIIFDFINKETARRILIDIIMKVTVKKFEKKGIDLSFSSSFADYILELGYNRAFGVRNLERTFEKEAITAISNYMFTQPDAKKISISIDNDKVRVN